ncbi:MAG: hypothetical protein WCW16_05010, partial [Candidatus Magasanikbacteria bacterium]
VNPDDVKDDVPELPEEELQKAGKLPPSIPESEENVNPDDVKQAGRQEPPSLPDEALQEAGKPVPPQIPEEAQQEVNPDDVEEDNEDKRNNIIQRINSFRYSKEIDKLEDEIKDIDKLTRFDNAKLWLLKRALTPLQAAYWTLFILDKILFVVERIIMALAAMCAFTCILAIIAALLYIIILIIRAIRTGMQVAYKILDKKIKDIKKKMETLEEGKKKYVDQVKTKQKEIRRLKNASLLGERQKRNENV